MPVIENFSLGAAGDQIIGGDGKRAGQPAALARRDRHIGVIRPASAQGADTFDVLVAGEPRRMSDRGKTFSFIMKKENNLSFLISVRSLDRSCRRSQLSAGVSISRPADERAISNPK
jgi:hypothetical protein